MGFPSVSDTFIDASVSIYILIRLLSCSLSLKSSWCSRGVRVALEVFVAFEVFVVLLVFDLFVVFDVFTIFDVFVNFDIFLYDVTFRVHLVRIA